MNDDSEDTGGAIFWLMLCVGIVGVVGFVWTCSLIP